MYYLKFLLCLFFLGLVFYVPCFGTQTNTKPPPTPQLYFPDADSLSALTIRIPFKMAGRLIVIQAGLGEKIGNFILDTGSSSLILNSVHFKGGVKKRGYVSIGTTGAVDDVKIKAVEDFSFPGLIFEKLYADVIDLGHLERKKNIEILGLIGYEPLKEFEIIVDFQLKQITLIRLDKKGNRLDSLALLEPIMDSLNFRLQAHIIAIDGKVDNTSVTFGLDTGAELNLLHKGIRRKVLNHFKISKRTVLNGMGQHEVEVLAGKLYKFTCGNQRLSGMRTLLTNMDEMNDAFNTNLDGLIGFEFLCMRRTIINYKKKKLYFLKWYHP